VRVGMIHQPHFLPWPGYVARCLAVDAFVVLDNVKFNKNHYQQRTKYVDLDGYERWLSLPIAHSTQSSIISQVRIAPAFGFMRWQRPFRHAYAQAPEFAQIWGNVGALIRQEAPNLLGVNLATLLYLLETVAVVAGRAVPEITLASSIDGSSDRTERLVGICSRQGITHLVMGRDALASHDCVRLQASGVVLVRHVYRGPPARAPRAGVTILHDILRLGRDELARRISTDWHIEPVLIGSIQ
jgi:hypothetical protein